MKVHLFGKLLAEALDQPGAREFVQDRAHHRDPVRPGAGQAAGRACRVGSADRLREAADRRSPQAGPRLADPSSLLWSTSTGRLPPRPLPNHLFQRDNSAWVYDGVSVNPMTKPARKRETINSQVVYNFHPMFRDADPPVHFYYGNDARAHEPANCEGGDILVIGNGAVMIGMGERTTPQGVEFLARQYFAHGSVPGSSRWSCRRPARSCTSTPR